MKFYTHVNHSIITLFFLSALIEPKRWSWAHKPKKKTFIQPNILSSMKNLSSVYKSFLSLCDSKAIRVFCFNLPLSVWPLAHRWEPLLSPSSSFLPWVWCHSFGVQSHCCSFPHLLNHRHLFFSRSTRCGLCSRPSWSSRRFFHSRRTGSVLFPLPLFHLSSCEVSSSLYNNIRLSLFADCFSWSEPCQASASLYRWLQVSDL